MLDVVSPAKGTQKRATMLLGSGTKAVLLE